MAAIATRERGAEILVRTITADRGDLPVEAARAFLGFRLSKEDTARVNQLAALARAGELSSEEREELDDYEFVTGLLEILQSKARRSLRNSGVTP